MCQTFDTVCSCYHASHAVLSSSLDNRVSGRFRQRTHLLLPGCKTPVFGMVMMRWYARKLQSCNVLTPAYKLTSAPVRDCACSSVTSSLRHASDSDSQGLVVLKVPKGCNKGKPKQGKGCQTKFCRLCCCWRLNARLQADYGSKQGSHISTFDEGQSLRGSLRACAKELINPWCIKKTQCD